ncbi:hypothetical protein PENTCL1PPCAC_19820, partial [Pristionchus entomophagus]
TISSLFRMGSLLSVMAAPQKTAASARTSHSQTGVAETEVAADATGRVAASDATAAGAAIAPTETAAAVESEEHIDQCGLEDDGEEWVRAEPPPRIRHSDLSKEKKEKFQGHLDRIFSQVTLMGKMGDFDPADLCEVFSDVIPYLESEQVLIENVPFPCSVVGDIHGQLYDLDSVFRKNTKDGKTGWIDHRYLFLGNYVDRGRQSLEVVVALYCLKMLYPDNIFLLRGNHEFIEENKEHGFLVDFFDRYEDEETALALYYRVNETFCYLSIAVIIGDAYYCAHGGISPSFFARRHFNSIYKPIYRSTDNSLVHDAVWSEPAVDLKGTCFNPDEGGSIYYGLKQLVIAMRR